MKHFYFLIHCGNFKETTPRTRVGIDRRYTASRSSKAERHTYTASSNKAEGDILDSWLCVNRKHSCWVLAVETPCCGWTGATAHHPQRVGYWLSSIFFIPEKEFFILRD